MRQRKFISVLTPAASSGEIDLLYSTVGTALNVSLTIACTGILAGDSERIVAQKIYNNIFATLYNTVMYIDQSQSSGNDINNNPYQNAAINQDGTLLVPPDGLEPANGIFDIPVYGSQTPSSQARPAWCSHVVSLFSQAQFTLDVTSNNTGSTIYLSTTPIYLTLKEANTIGPLRRQNWRDSNNIAYTNDQIIQLLEYAGNEWLGITNNYVVQSCFVHEEDGFMTDGIQLKKYPLIEVDVPRVRRPSILQTLVADTTTIDILSKYIVNRDSGYITFRFAQNLVFNYEPFEIFNEIKVSYIGGMDSIPAEVKMIIVDITTFSNPPRQMSELKSGTTSIKFLPLNALYKDLMNRYRTYFRSGDE